MQRGTKLAKKYAKAHDKLRKWFFQGYCLKVLSGDDGQTLVATYDSGWWLDNHEHSDVVAGKKYKRVIVEDVQGCRLAQLKAATMMQVGNQKFKFVAKPSFLGSVPSYEFKLQPTGERV